MCSPEDILAKSKVQKRHVALHSRLKRKYTHTIEKTVVTKDENYFNNKTM